jgi:hypothetical protein
MATKPDKRITSHILRAILRACDYGPGGVRVLPTREVLSTRLERTPDSGPSVSALSTFHLDTDLARAVGAVTPSQIKAARHRKRLVPGRGSFSTTAKVCGRLFADDSRQHRDLLAGRNDGVDSDVGVYLDGLTSPDCNVSVRRALQVVEDLPSSTNLNANT